MVMVVDIGQYRSGRGFKKREESNIREEGQERKDFKKSESIKASKIEREVKHVWNLLVYISFALTFEGQSSSHVNDSINSLSFSLSLSEESDMTPVWLPGQFDQVTR